GPVAPIDCTVVEQRVKRARRIVTPPDHECSRADAKRPAERLAVKLGLCVRRRRRRGQKRPAPLRIRNALILFLERRTIRAVQVLPAALAALLRVRRVPGPAASGRGRNPDRQRQRRTHHEQSPQFHLKPPFRAKNGPWRSDWTSASTLGPRPRKRNPRNLESLTARSGRPGGSDQGAQSR